MILERELHIGAHVLFNGNREEVRSISIPWVELYGIADFLHSDELEPIPLTSELLVELGFKKQEGGLIWSRIYDKNCYVSFSPFEDNCWSLSITPKDYRKRITAFVNNLHEAEAFVRLTLKRELLRS